MSPELVGVIEGGAIGLLTTVVGYVFAWAQLKSTRAFDLRQAVYVESMATMALALEFFSKVSQLDVEDGELTGLLQLTSAAVHKVQVVGTPTTIAALSGANECLTIAGIGLMARRTTLRDAADASRLDPAGAGAQVARLKKTLFLESMRASLRYQQALVAVNVSARRELGLPLSEAQYRRVCEATDQRILAVIDSTSRELEEQGAS